MFKKMTPSDLLRLGMSNITNLGGIHNLKHFGPNTDRPQLHFMWEVLVSDNNGGGENIGFYAKSTAIPARIVEPIKAYVCGTEYNYAGRDVSPRTVRISFFDNEDQEVWEFFKYWMTLTNDGLTKTKVTPREYYRDITIKLKTALNDTSATHVFKDCYPVEIGEVPLSYGDSDAVAIDITLAYHDHQAGSGLGGDSGSIFNNSSIYGLSSILSSAIKGVLR